MSKKSRNRHRSLETGIVEEPRDRMELEGYVEEALPGIMFRVQTDNGLTVLATLCGKMRLNHIRVLTGDRVLTEVSPYDTSRGRIVRRRT